jgi:hypothetical protein
MSDTSDLTENLVRMADWYKGQAHYYMDQAAKAERERDEARDIVEKLTGQGLDLMDANRTLKRERDEARELVQQMSESSQVILADLRHYREEWKKLKEGAA